jgi:GNAT superfamily N-acetyltransferase
MKLEGKRFNGNTPKYGEKLMEEAEKYLFTTKKGEDVFLYIEPVSGICSFAKLFSAKDIGCYHKLLLASYDLIWEFDGSCRIFIGDLQMAQQNTSKGYGTLLMDFMLMLAKKNKATSISGLLGSSELMNPENKKRMLNFYKKYGFTIRLNEQETSGEIYLPFRDGLPRNTSHI